jgi:hypothetical protein
MIEGFWRDTGKRKFRRAVQHRVIQSENSDTRQTGENPKIVIKVLEALLKAAFVFPQRGSRNVRVFPSYIARRDRPGKELPYGVSLGSRLALRANRLPCFTQANIGKVQHEFAGLSTFQ